MLSNATGWTQLANFQASWYVGHLKNYLTDGTDVHFFTSSKLEIKATSSNPFPSFLYSSNTNIDVGKY